MVDSKVGRLTPFVKITRKYRSAGMFMPEGRKKKPALKKAGKGALAKT